MTRQRALILNLINETREHPTAERVYEMAKAQMPTMVLATVYNNLNALTEQGLIRRLHTYGSPDRYDNVMVSHDHMVCDRCGAIADVFAPSILSELQKNTGKDITSYELILHYVCDDCLGKDEAQKH